MAFPASTQRSSMLNHSQLGSQTVSRPAACCPIRVHPDQPHTRTTIGQPPSAQPANNRPVVVAAAAGKGATKSKGFGAANAPSVSKSGVSQTCACGSKSVYRECCEPYHLGAAIPADVEAALRARFCAFVKGRVPYLLSTFHPSYLAFKYDGTEPGGSAAQLKRDVEAAVKRFNYSNLKVLGVQPGAHEDEAHITFRYSSVNKFNPEKNYDGTIKVSTTVERSRFLRDPLPYAPAQPAATTEPRAAPAGAAAGAAASGAADGAAPTAAPAAAASATAPIRPWRFADYTLIDYPSWKEEAKQAELRARGQLTEEAATAGAGAGAGSS